MSDDELHWLYPDRSDEDVAGDWLGRGRALVVITRGGASVYAISARDELRRPAMAVDLVDTVGAGCGVSAPGRGGGRPEPLRPDRAWMGAAIGGRGSG